MVRVKNDGPLILEWLAHYVVLGVEHFYVYDNGSDDNTVEILVDFVDKGLVTLVRFPTVPITPSCLVDFFDNWAWETEWCCFFDSDEFLRLPRDMNIYDVIAAQPTALAIAVNWRFMGSGWLSTLPEGLMTENLVHGDKELDSHIKVIVRTRDVRRFRNSHNFYYKRARFARSYCGQPVHASFCEARSSDIWLAHYVYRGEKNYLYKSRQPPPEGTTSARRVEFSAREYQRHNETIIPPDEEVLMRIKQQLALWNASSPG